MDNNNFALIYYMVIYLILVVTLCHGIYDGLYRCRDNFKSSTDSKNLITTKYPFNWDYDDKTIDKFIQSLKGKEYELRKNQKLSDSLKTIIKGKFNIIDVKNIVAKEDKFFVPLFIGKFQETIVRRVILVLKVINNKVIIDDVIIPENLKSEELQILPSFNLSSLVKTTNMDYKDISTNPLLEDDLILTPEIKPKKSKKEQSSMCYGIPEFQKIPNKEQCNLFGGVWDKPVKHSEECPFYKKNRNYPNDRGGAKFGRCELPLGMKLLGFRYYSLEEIYSPLCYGCSLKNSSLLDKCCDSQKNPDYAFSGDSSQRRAHGLKSYSDVD